MTETLIEQMRRTWAASDHETGAPMYWSLTPDAWDQLRYEKRGEMGNEFMPEFMGYPVYRGGPGIPRFMLLAGEPPDDHLEWELKRRLDMLHREYRKLCQPLIDQLVEIENRKPPGPIIFDSAFGDGAHIKVRLGDMRKLVSLAQGGLAPEAERG